MIQRIGGRMVPLARVLLMLAAVGAALANGHKWT
jgi:hypothetical protein